MEKNDHNEQSLREIASLREVIQKFALLSVPGVLWHLERLSNTLVEMFGKNSDEVTQIIQENSLLLGISLTVGLIPFEIAEYKMAELKGKIRDYANRNKEKVSPIIYTRVEILVNTIMKLMHDRSELIPDQKFDEARKITL